MRRFASRYASFAAARIALVIGRWFVLLQGARHLDKYQFATLAAALSAAEILRSLADVGADSFIYSRLGKPGSRLRVTVRAALQLRASIGAILTVLALLTCLVLPDTAAVAPIFLLIAASVAQYSGVAILQKAADFRKLSLLVGITFAGSLAVDIGMVLATPTLPLTAVLLVAPDVISGLVALLLAGPGIAAIRIDHGNARRRLHALLAPIAGKLAPGAALSVLVVAYSRLDLMVVRPVAGAAAQADYSAGFRLIEPAFMFFAIASTALLAELGSSAATKARTLGSRLAGLPALLLFCGVLTAGMLLGAIAYVFSIELFGLRPGIALFAALLAVCIPLRVLNSLHTALLQRLGRFDAVTRASFINGLIALVAGASLTYWIDARGAAVAALLGEAVNWLLQRRALKRAIQRPVFSGGTQP